MNKQKFDKDMIEKFKIINVYPNGFHGNDIDIELKDGTVYQIAVEKDIELPESLVGKYVELKHIKKEGKYYFERINYSLHK